MVLSDGINKMAIVMAYMRVICQTGIAISDGVHASDVPNLAVTLSPI